MTDKVKWIFMFNNDMAEPWYRSNTKVGAVLIGTGLILGGIGKFLTGDYDINTTFTQVLAGVGAIFGGIGLRNALTKM